MKKIGIIFILGFNLFSCKNAKKNDEKVEQKIETSKVESTKNETKSNDLNWDEMPDLKEIGNFPFVTAPQGLIIYNEKNGLTDIFDYETMENFTGSKIITTEGKLGIIYFSENFNQKLFDKSFYDYFDKIGAKQLYKGNFPEDEKLREQLAKNMWNGKVSSYGLQRQSNTPFAVYAFKNNSQKYILNIQSNSAQGNVFIMELKDFEQTIKKYSAAEMKNEIDKTGKAILNINFDTDKATIKADGQPIIVEILALLNANSNFKLSIEGHTDNSGTPEHNKQLSIDRANTVMNSLVSSGIDKNRLKATGFGSEKSISANDTEENKAKNRRVELVKF
jgi:OmpA-OmpF porin, OOP family